jgi:hypothetical protein
VFRCSHCSQYSFYPFQDLRWWISFIPDTGNLHLSFSLDQSSYSLFCLLYWHILTVWEGFIVIIPSIWPLYFEQVHPLSYVLLEFIFKISFDFVIFRLLTSPIFCFTYLCSLVASLFHFTLPFSHFFKVYSGRRLDEFWVSSFLIQAFKFLLFLFFFFLANTSI